MGEPRSKTQRRADVLELLMREEDAWVASASATGDAYLIPLSYIWDGARLTFATLVRSRTVRDLRRAGRARVALPSARDVVILDGAVTIVPLAADDALAAAFAARIGWDPRGDHDEYTLFCVTPDRIQAWRDVAELAGREIMRDGRWLE